MESGPANVTLSSRMTLDDLPTWFVRGIVVVFGLLWGSFLNVVIYRVPRELSVVSPGSRCPACEKPIPGWHNLPVLSWLILRGRAACCGVRVSARYPLVELLGGVLSYGIFEVIVRGMPGHPTLGHIALVYGANFALAMGLVAAAFIDVEHMFLPDAITVGGAILGLATARLRGMTFADSAIGAVGAFLAIWIPFGLIYKRLLGRTGMGMGDAKLLALAGAWFGWPGAAVVLFGGAIQGTLYAVVAKITGRELGIPDAAKQDLEELRKAAEEGDEEAKALLAEDPLAEEGAEGRSRIPFGPFLILAILELMFFGELIWLEVGPLFRFPAS